MTGPQISIQAGAFWLFFNTPGGLNVLEATRCFLEF